MIYSIKWHHTNHCGDDDCLGNCKDWGECCAEYYGEMMEEKRLEE